MLMIINVKTTLRLPLTQAGARQKGTVIITVLMLVAVATYLAVELTHRQRIDITRTGTLLALDQSEEYVLSAEALAQYVLEEDLKSDIKANELKDDLGEDWPTRVVKPIGRGIIDGQIYDLQGRFNLNRLLDNEAETRAQLERLLSSLNIPAESDTNLTAKGVAERIGDWVDEGHDPNTDGLESQDYLLLDPPYNAGNRLLVDLSELLLVTGISREDLELLAPHVSLLPPTMPLNLNTATEEVLEAMGCLNVLNIVAQQQAGAILEKDRTGGLALNGEFADKSCTKPPEESLYTVKSNFFLLDAKSEVDKRSIHMHSILYRSGDAPTNVKARVILRKQLDPFSGV